MLVEVDFKALGLAISKYRHVANLSQEKLAERVGLSTKFIGNIERGASKLSVNTLINLSYALNLPLGDLLDPSIARAVEPHEDHCLRDSGCGYVNTLTAFLLSQEEMDDETFEETDGPHLGILEIDDQLLKK